jgi:glycosyltransferase involved in cell wall biosynthesis
MSRPLRIAEIAPLWVSVPPADYGGIERMVGMLSERFVKRGHEVTLFASGDSRTSAKLFSVCNESIASMMGSGLALEYDHYIYDQIHQVIERSGEFDIIHSHIGARYIPLFGNSKTPVLHTLRTALTPDDLWIFERHPQCHLSAISRSQISRLPTPLQSRIQVIYNGLDVADFEFSDKPEGYLAFLGRMSHDKNPLDAILFSKEVGIPILLAGSPKNSDETRYFHDEIQPLIDDQSVHYIGPVNHAQKNVLLKTAKAFIFPICWDEPFGNVLIEAMACGTPVLAYSRGAVPEIVQNGLNGFHGPDLASLRGQFEAVDTLDRAEVRWSVETRFHIDQAAGNYLELFHKIIQSLG